MNELPVGPLQPADSRSDSNVVTYVPMSERAEWESASVSIRDILGMLRRKAWLIVVVTVLVLTGVVFFLSRETPLYHASAMIRLSDSRRALTQAVVDNTGDNSRSVDPMMSEIMVLEGRGVAQEVVDREGLRLYSVTTGIPASIVDDVEVTLQPDETLDLELRFGKERVVGRAGGQRVQAEYGTPMQFPGVRFVVPKRPPQIQSEQLTVVPRERAVDYVQGSIDAELVVTGQYKSRTDAVDVSVDSTDPLIAPRIVNAAVHVYQEVNASSARDEVTRRREFLEDQLRNNDSLLVAAQSALGGLRGRSQTYSAQQKFSAEQANLMQVEIRREELRVNRRMHESVLQALIESRDTGSSANMSALLSTPGIGGNPVIASLHSQLVNYQASRDEATSGPWAQASTHPEVQRYNTLIASTEQKLVDAVRSQINSLDAQIEALGSLTARAEAAMGGLPSAEVEELRLIDQIETLRTLGGQLRAAYQTTRIEEAVEAGQVEIVHLASGAGRVRSNPFVKLALALALGLMLGSGLAIVREKMDDSIHRPEDIDEILQLPLLAIIPRMESTLKKGILRRLLPGMNGKADHGGSERLESLRNLDNEAFRVLRTNLLFAPSGPTLKTLVVTSAAPQEGKTLTATNLATAFAHQGLRVVLVDCDLRRPALGRIFGNSGESDLTDLILNKEELGRAIRPSGIEGLDILPTFTSPPNPSELLGGSYMKEVLHELAQRYDMIVLDSPPLLLAADAAVLGVRADGVLLVVRAGSTDRSALHQAVDQLSSVGARVVGAVLNDPDDAVERYGGGYRHYKAYSRSA